MRRLPLPLSLLLAGLGLGLSGEPEPVALSDAQCLKHDCFGVFWARKSFAEASEACERSGGHLMTVRSTVAEDAIALLLHNRSGALWLGLMLHSPCVEPSQSLRGFKWVTGDSRTDYTNWAPSGRPCPEQCVTVSRYLLWEERRCEEPADGFLCEYSYGDSCPQLPLAEGLAVTYTTPFGARGGDFQALPPRSTASVPALGLELRCDEERLEEGLQWSRDAPGAWPCSLLNGGCEGTCGEEGGRPRCSCPDGKALGADGRGCVSLCAGKACQHYCVENGTGFSCMCEVGYRLAADSYHCEDIDDCAVLPNLCEQVCVNTEGGFECRCHSGYEMQGERCRRINPCDSALCEQQCEELPDGYRCGCYPGYAVDPQVPTRCLLHCNSSRCPAQCSKHSDSCECPEGFVLDDADERTCVDLDECAFNYCDHECRNYPGGYECFCQAGYEVLDKVFCVKSAADEEGPYSGDSERPSQPPAPSRTPPKAEDLHLGVLVGIAVGALSAALALLALGYHLAKKRCRSPATMDYKCSGPHEKEMGLQPVTSVCVTPSQKL
ncbi:TRBM protein, partial [Psilopogon haemacephalus]|nr:TRBM protein [Psilopogon haemacephalus]